MENYDNFDLDDIVQKRNDVIDLKQNLQKYVQRLRKHETNLAIKERYVLKGGLKCGNTTLENKKTKPTHILFSIISDIINTLMIPTLSYIGFTPNLQELKDTILMVEDYREKIENLKEKLEIESEELNKIIFLITSFEYFFKKLTKKVPMSKINEKTYVRVENKTYSNTLQIDTMVFKNKIAEKLKETVYTLKDFLLIFPVLGNITNILNKSTEISRSLLDLQRDINKVLRDNGQYFDTSVKRLIELTETTLEINEKIKGEISEILGKAGTIKIKDLTHNLGTDTYKNIIDFFNEHFREASFKIRLVDIKGNQKEKEAKVFILRLLLTILITLTLFPEKFYEKLPLKIREFLLKIQMCLKSNILIEIPLLQESIVKHQWGLVVSVIGKTILKEIAPDMIELIINNGLDKKKPIDLFSFFIEKVVPDMTLVDIILTALEKLIKKKKSLPPKKLGGKKSKKNRSRKRIKKKGKYTRKR